MATTQSSKATRRNTSSKHSGTIDSLGWEGSSIKTRSKNDAISWEESSTKTRNKSSSHTLHRSLDHRGSTSTNIASSDHTRKSVPQFNSDPSPSASKQSNLTKTSETSTTQSISTESKVTAQLLKHDNIWYEVKEEFPLLDDYFQETKLDKQLSQILTNLFKLKQLPFSPFCQLMCELRPTMERYLTCSALN